MAPKKAKGTRPADVQPMVVGAHGAPINVAVVGGHYQVQNQGLVDGTPKKNRVSAMMGEALDARKKKKFRRRPCWTGALLFTWLMVAVVVLLTHIAVSKIIPPIKNLPSNVLKGFDDVFRFKALGKDGEAVRDNATAGMASCYTMPDYSLCDSMPTRTVCVLSQCQTLKDFAPLDKKTDTEKYLLAINASFARSLAKILQVTEDRCLAADGFNETASGLKKILAQVAKLGEQTKDMPCQASWVAYCGIYKAGNGIMQGASGVTKTIDAMANSKDVKKMTDYMENLKLMHGLPYILVLSMAFFTLFWWFSGGVCCCCRGGNCLGCFCCLIPHLLLWVVYAALASAVVIIGYMVPKVAETTKISFSSGGCTIADLMDHIELTYNGFYTLVFKDLIAGCLLFEQAFRAALAMCMLSGIYAYCVCVMRPYGREKNGKFMTANGPVTEKE